MAYLIHTNHQVRPFLTTIAFIARDFSLWGYRVDHYAAGSAYITEIRSRERIFNRGERKTMLMELWARESIARKRDVLPQEECGTHQDGRLDKASTLVHDFLCGITPMDKHSDHNTIKKERNYIVKHMRHLHALRFITNAPLPPWSTLNITHADQIIIEFRNFHALKVEHLIHALDKAVEKDEGRMGSVERDAIMGITKVMLLVDVGECLVPVYAEEEMDPVPVYERREKPPAYTA